MRRVALAALACVVALAARPTMTQAAEPVLLHAAGSLRGSLDEVAAAPRTDPSGDYAWEVFRKADAQRPGAFAAFSHKALQLTGAPSSVTAPAGRSLYGMRSRQRRRIRASA